MGLRETLEAATSVDRWGKHGLGPVIDAQERLMALAPELAALCLEMGDYLRDLGLTRYGDEPGDLLLARLARLDQLGKEPA